jgi:hypothetical protein
MKKMMFQFVIAALLMGSQLFSAQLDSVKEAQWNKMKAQVDDWCDGLGMPIDEGIKKSVIVFNLLGFKTDASCEGHLNWGCQHPWIDLSVKDITELKWKELKALLQQFYAQKKSGDDHFQRTLVLIPIEDGHSNIVFYRLRSKGGSCSSKEKKSSVKKLKAYQDEMLLFTDFLVDYYSSQASVK